MNPDIFLINAGGSRKRVYQNLSISYSAVDTPFWAALTAGYLRKEGFEVALLDANAENLDFDETVDRIEKINPRLIALVCYSQQANVSTPIMVAVGELCRKIKERIPVHNLILTGWHPSALPERTLKEEACDFVVQGEGFYTLKNLLRSESPEMIPGLWYRANNEIRGNPRAKNVENLTEELSEVAWDLLPMNDEKYRAFNWMCLGDLESRGKFVSMFTSLGCPFKCNFCAIHATYGEHRLRCWTPEWVMNQLDLLVSRYAIKNINLHDELFVFRKNHFYPIAQGIIEKGYNLNIASFARVDILDKMTYEELSTLKKAGFNWFKLGIETYNSSLILNNSKGRYNEDTVKNVVKKIHDCGINLCANFMFGLPGDTLDTMKKNLDFALELQCAFPSFFCTMAIPGSELYNCALKNNSQLPDSWLGYASQGYDFFPLPNENLSAEEILRFRDYAFETYFTDKRYLDMVEKRFGKRTLEHIQGMTAIKLKRKILGD